MDIFGILILFVVTVFVFSLIEIIIFKYFIKDENKKKKVSIIIFCSMIFVIIIGTIGLPIYSSIRNTNLLIESFKSMHKEENINKIYEFNSTLIILSTKNNKFSYYEVTNSNDNYIFNEMVYKHQENDNLTFDVMKITNKELYFLHMFIDNDKNYIVFKDPNKEITKYCKPKDTTEETLYECELSFYINTKNDKYYLVTNDNVVYLKDIKRFFNQIGIKY